MLALYRKYRPAKFSELIGQDMIRDTLLSEVANKMLAHAYLFTGPRGLGKTSTARILAAAVNCERLKDGEPCGECSRCVAIRGGRYLDLIEIDAASQTGVDNVRENIIESARFIPQAGPYKIYILDEAHMLSTSAWNALLKTLEEPPLSVIFIFATTESRKIPDTILSRCQQFRFRPVEHEVLKKRLVSIAKAESIIVDEEVFDEVALRAGGYVRDAESLLGQLFSLGGKSVTWKDAQVILERSSLESVSSFLKTLLKGDAENAFQQLNELQEEGVDVPRFTLDLLEALRAMHYRAITEDNHPLYIRRHGKAGIAMIGEMLKLQHDQAILRKALGIIIDQLDKSREVPSDLVLEIIAGDLAHHFSVSSGSQSNTHNENVSAQSGSSPLGMHNFSADATKPLERLSLSETGLSPRKIGIPSRRIEASEQLPHNENDRTLPPVSPAPVTEQKDRSQIKNIPAPAIKANIKEAVVEPISETLADESAESKLESKKHNPVGITLHKVKELWETVIEKVHKKNHALPFVLKFAEPLEVQANQVRLGCKYQFHHDRLINHENRLIVEQALSEVLGAPTVIKIEFVAAPIALPKPEDAAFDKMVNLFGGKVVER
ncbi:MAG: DNA polymerase III subunit gamma/tau [Patescibacteria group bacterium]